MNGFFANDKKQGVPQSPFANPFGVVSLNLHSQGVGQR